MQRLAELCIRRPVFASMIVLSIVVIGAASYFQLSLDKHPQVELPTIAVRTLLPGASPEEVETSIVPGHRRSGQHDRRHPGAALGFRTRLVERHHHVQSES